jgi:uncharacterized protein YcaQ
VISPTVARRLAITSQRLAGPTPAGGAGDIMETVRQLGCLQLDPISVVAPSHRLVLWSRLGAYDLAALQALQWETRQLFQYWAHAASIVPTADYPIHHRLMLAWRRREVPWPRFMQWIADNARLKRYIMGELRRRGPLPSRTLEDRATRAWPSSGWTSGRNVDRMLSYLWLSGTAAVAGREGGQRLWDLAEHWLPPSTPKDRLSAGEVARRAALRSLGALGVARPIDIQRHFIRNRYDGLNDILKRLLATEEITPVQIRDGTTAWKGSWYVRTQELPLVDRLEAGDWQPRTTLLSPFDNLICDRARTSLMFGFDFTVEIYVPAARRKYGYYVLSILDGDRLIGRIDAAADRKRGDLALKAVHMEPVGAARDAGARVAESVRALADFIGMRTVTPTGPLPTVWRRALNAAL